MNANQAKDIKDNYKRYTTSAQTNCHQQRVPSGVMSNTSDFRVAKLSDS